MSLYVHNVRMCCRAPFSRLFKRKKRRLQPSAYLVSVYQAMKSGLSMHI